MWHYVDIFALFFLFAFMVAPISHAQIRAARSMIDETQEALAKRAKITRGVLKLLEDPRRKRPDLQILAKVRAALEEKGVEFLDATEDIGEGVRYLKPEERGWTEMVRHARALLDVSLDDMAELSMVGRYTISRVERGGLSRPPEDAIRRLREAFAANNVLITPDMGAFGASVRFKVRMS